MLKTNVEEIYSDLMEEVKLFIPNDFDRFEIEHIFSTNDNIATNEYKVSDGTKEITHKKIEEISPLFTAKKLSKIGLYEALSKFFEKSMPWGALTGIRPTKMAWDLINSGFGWSALTNFFKEKYHVSDKKISLLLDTLQNQRNLIVKNDKNVDFYVNIPFCITRCNYCSFVSCDISKVQEYIDPYIDCLIMEIQAAKKMIREKGLIVRTVYIGGGTPTSLRTEQLERIIEEIGYNVNEFTVEVGRADTVTKENLDMLSKHNVSRISINPQTFNDKILQKIGRTTTASQILQSYKLARKYNFKINMDFIVGLEGESFKSFVNNMDIVNELQPDNVTIHTLSLKRASENARENKDIFKKQNTVEKTLDYCYEYLKNVGYKPYYMYRQKNMVGGFENVGFCKDGTACIFNVNSMEEVCSVVACGANAISKRIFLTDNKIERCANQKDFKTYIDKIDEIIEKKEKLFK